VISGALPPRILRALFGGARLSRGRLQGDDAGCCSVEVGFRSVMIV